jgi:hypothetical protein
MATKLEDIISAPRGAENKAGKVIPETPKPEAVASENKPEQIFLAQSKDELFLRQIMEESKAEPNQWAEEIVVDEKYKSMFALPTELAKGPRQDSQAKDKSYCWVEVSDQRVARLYQKDGWVPVNRTNHAWLPNSYFSIHGGIERNGYSRHLLFYQPKKFNEAMKMAAVKQAQDRLESNKSKLENASGPVRLEEVTTSGGYGVTPDAPPIETDWQGNRTDEATV